MHTADLQFAMFKIYGAQGLLCHFTSLHRANTSQRKHKGTIESAASVQDTEFLDKGNGQAKSGMGDQTECFQVYEDTSFINMPAAVSGSPPARDEHRGPHGTKDWGPRNLPAADQENSTLGKESRQGIMERLVSMPNRRLVFLEK